MKQKPMGLPRMQPKKFNLVLTLSGITTGLLISNHAYGNQTFPSQPLHLQNETSVTTPAGVKPNIMLYIDDSGSMMSNSISVPGFNQNQSRMAVVQRALNDVLLKYTDSVNWGYQTLHGTKRNNLDYYYRDRPSTWYEGVPLSELRTWQGLGINATNWCNNNIIGSTNYVNPNPGTAQSNGRQHFTDDYQTIRKYVACTGRENNATPTTTRYTAITNNMLNNSNLKNRCQKSYIVLLSDGDASAGQGPLSNVSQPLFNNDQKRSGNDVWNGSWNDPKYLTQNINTYTVGFGSGLSNTGRDYLRNGATVDSNGNKNYFSADSSAQLIAAFDQIFEAISNDSVLPPQQVYSSSAPAISSNYIDGLAAAASLNTGSWSSELLFFNINNNGALDTNNPLRASFNNRKLLVSDGSSVRLYNNAMNGHNNPWFDIPAASNNNTSNNNNSEWRDGLLKWMARESTDANIKTSNNRFVLDYRVRPVRSNDPNSSDERSMGDIIDNSIIAIGPMQNRKQQFIVTSTNDGLVYVFESANSNTNPYDLKFNYAPAKMDRHSNNGSDYVGKYYKDLANKDYGRTANTPHRYLLNGSMVARTTDFGGSGQQMFLVSTMGQAGRGAFAINIGGKNRTTGAPIAASNINTNNWHNSVKLFETENGNNNNLGFTISSPEVGRIQYQPSNTTTTEKTLTNDIRYATFLANGYNYSPNYTTNNTAYQDKPALYIYETLGQDVGLNPTNANIASGTLLKRIDIPNGSGGLSTPTLIDANFDGLIDYAYAGDYAGALYRFDFTSANPSNWGAVKIFQTPANQPITAAPAVYRKDATNFSVSIGTGSDIYQEDLSKKLPQAIYTILDNTTQNTQIGINQLLEQTLSNPAQNASLRMSSNNSFDSSTHRGWFIKLDPNNGERITTKPNVVGNSLILSTRIYEKQTIAAPVNEDPCVQKTESSSTSAYSWILQFDINDGSAIMQNNSSVYVDFNLGNDAIYSQTPSGTGSTAQKFVYAGQRQSTLTSLTFINTLSAGSSQGVNGDSGGSGQDPNLNANAKIPKNYCVGEGSKIFTFNTAGVSDTLNVQGVCNSIRSAKRLSWKEIF